MTEPATSRPPAQLSAIDRLFLTPEERRPRAFWRLTAHAFLFLFLSGCLTAPVLFVPGILSPQGGIRMEAMLVTAVGGAIAIAVATALARRFLDRRPFLSLGLRADRNTAPDLFVGFLIPALPMALVYTLEAVLGWTRWQGWAWQVVPWPAVVGNVALALAVFALVAFQEELLSRGYQLQNLVEGMGAGLAVAVSSLIFALLHGANPGVTPAAVLGLILAGAFLAFGWLRTGQLWLSIGLHFGWNFFEGTVFGFQVSGLELFTVMRHAVSGPEWATGGAFGPEAGAVMLPAYALGLALVAAYTRRRPRPSFTQSR